MFVKDNTKLLLFGEETVRLQFDQVTQHHFVDWLRFCSETNSLKFIFPNDNRKPEQLCEVWFERVFFRYANNLGGMNALIDKNTQILVGQCGLLVQTVDQIEELEIGYSLMPESRGKGYALEAAKKCRDFAFHNQLSDSLISIIHPENLASIQVAKNNGMRVEKRTIFHGIEVCIYRITREEWEIKGFEKV
jgi:[ribosomal protein S5]-alanine N-acetyltransferase